jgi:rhamnose transport system ATP-binding protein
MTQAAAPVQVPVDEAAQPVVDLRDVTKQFGAVRALRGVHLPLYAGEVHALVGENGAGKSTLVKMLGGIHQPDSGSILVNGIETGLSSPLAARARGIAVIQQHPFLFPDLDVAENVFMGRHPRTRFGRIDWRRMNREVDDLLRSLGVAFSATTPVRGLSVADQQMVEIAKALSQNASVLVMDEPTASLSAREVERLFAIVRRLRDQGVALLFVSHRLDEVAELADRVTIFRDGGHVITAPASELTTDQIIRHMVGRQLDSLYPKEIAEIGDVALSVHGLSRLGTFLDITFELRRGEILGLFGLVGAGRTEVARVIFGIDHAEHGTITLGGDAISIGDPTDAMNHGIAYVPEDRHAQGLILTFPIDDNITLPIIRRLSRFTLVDSAAVDAVAAEYARRLQVKSAGLDQLVSALSGGNQQKVVLGKWLATEPTVLILDEPTRGIDIGTKAEVHRIISHLATEGLAILLISSELPEVLGMADRILVMHEGRISGEFERSVADQERIMFAATGQVATVMPA